MNFLEELVGRGFTFHVFEAYPKQLGAAKSNFIMLLDLSDEGHWSRFSSPGYLIEDQIGLLIERAGRQMFVHKSTAVPADEALLAGYRAFCQELDELLARQENPA